MTTRTKDRRALVAALVRDGKAPSHRAIAIALAAHGFDVSQATVSRDLDTLGLFRRPKGWTGTAAAKALRAMVALRDAFMALGLEP